MGLAFCVAILILQNFLSKFTDRWTGYRTVGFDTDTPSVTVRITAIPDLVFGSDGGQLNQFSHKGAIMLHYDQNNVSHHIVRPEDAPDISASRFARTVGVIPTIGIIRNKWTDLP